MTSTAEATKQDPTVDKIEVVSGNKSAAYGAMVCGPDVIGVYPITPQTSVVEDLTQFKADGLLKAEILEAEGEISAMGSVLGASAAGGRTFSSTSSMGLFFMFDSYIMAPLYRLPIVMVNSNRELLPPNTVACSHQDIMEVIETGWIHIHVEDSQEILDTIIMAYRLAEDPDILLPVDVCYDGFYLSYLREPVKIPKREVVSDFLPHRDRPVLSLDDPMFTCIHHINSHEMAEMRYRHQQALELSKQKLLEVEEEFRKVFGRSYGGLLEEYRMEGAEYALLCMGSHTGTAKVVVDQKREEGYKVGLIKLRMFRPFPEERVVEALRGIKALSIIDRSVAFGWKGGHLYREVRSALYGHSVDIPIADYIAGLGGHDITIPLIHRIVDDTAAMARGEAYQQITWLAMEEE
jgi:pyruvate ferredoxin oxidoreductase alpha subunit/phenylglyoxylate dehydrogenase alpha subunit